VSLPTSPRSRYDLIQGIGARCGMRRRDFIRLVGGLAGTWPLTARAQQAATPVVGFMSGRSQEDSVLITAAFRQGLADLGFVEGQTVKTAYRWADGDYDKLPTLAADLVDQKVAVLVGVGGDVSAVAAVNASKTVPVVFGMGGDPVKAGLVASFSRPGGNVTGFTLWTNEMESKRLGLLRELMPDIPLIGVLVNPRFPPAEQELLDLRPAAAEINQKLFVARANDDAELDAALASFAEQHVGALLVTAAPFFDTRHDRIVRFAAQNKLPAMYQFREYVAAGGLISYGPNVAESYKNGGTYVGRILKGEKPADLPIMQPTKFDFLINLKTAKALGLTVPPTLLARADEVIE
jgi:putative ABC transport system substrate-binding protein